LLVLHLESNQPSLSAVTTRSTQSRLVQRSPIRSRPTPGERRDFDLPEPNLDGRHDFDSPGANLDGDVISIRLRPTSAGDAVPIRPSAVTIRLSTVTI
jgi:hypothetical protein